MPRKISLPKIEHVKILNYALYPGKPSDETPNSGTGLDHAFLDGITVIIGINGLGKTTLLNALIYSLLGPKLLSKAQQVDLGTGRYKLDTSPRISYFASRVKDFAKDATIELTFSIGHTRVHIKRKLSNLKIEALAIGNRIVHEPDESRYLEEMAELCGLQDEYQFHVVVKYLLFFVEGHISLLWDRESQFEMLRILFLDEGTARQLAELKSSIMQQDSQMRNIRAVLGQLVKQYGDVPDEPNKEERDQIEAELRMLEQQAKGAQDQYSDLEKQRIDQFERLQSLQERKFLVDVEIAETEQHIRSTHDNYLRTISPSMEDTVRLLLGTLLEGGGCDVCGSRDETTRLRVQQDLAAERCPVCHSPGSLQEQGPAIPIDSASLKRMLESVSAKRQVAAEIVKEIEKETQAYAEIQGQVREAAQRRYEAGAQVEQKLSQLPAQSDAMQAVRRRMLENKLLVESMKEELAKKHKAYTKLARGATEELARITRRIRSTFSFYAKEFLQETASLEYKQIKVPLGQEHKVLLPSFSVKMTSSVEVSTPLIRETENSVSESQREFLELAFRMALMTVATRGRNGGLLVMETPEASLDAIFIRRAARMLRQFAGMGKRLKGAQVIASSNISGAEMIQALLGIEKGPKTRGERERRARVINLLEIAAPNAAYRKEKAGYDELLAEATGL